MYTTNTRTNFVCLHVLGRQQALFTTTQWKELESDNITSNEQVSE